jgi:hypothetical protein
VGLRSVKHVFVETNFLVAVTRPLSHPTAKKLLEDGRRGLVALHIPWCAVTEARRTMQHIINEDLGFDTQMLGFALKELFPTDKAKFAVVQELAGKVRTARRLASADLNSEIDTVIASMRVIPPSAEAVDRTLSIWTVKNLPPFDEMVLGTVLAKAMELYQAGERELFFCNLNKSDFSPEDKGGQAITRPELAAAYAACGLTYKRSFEV